MHATTPGLAYISETSFQHEVFVLMPTLNVGSRSVKLSVQTCKNRWNLNIFKSITINILYIRLPKSVNSRCLRFTSRQGLKWKFIVNIHKFLIIIISGKCSDLVEIITRKRTSRENCQYKCKFNYWNLWLHLVTNTSRRVTLFMPL
jgi:hypothetical protein